MAHLYDTVAKVKTDWKAVQDKYGRALKKWMTACRSGAGQITFGQPKILTQLSWLSEFIRHRSTESNFPVCRHNQRVCVCGERDCFQCIL